MDGEEAFVGFTDDVEAAINEVCFNMLYFMLYSWIVFVPLLSVTVKVFPSDDPMDKRDFDPVKYINELFPSEQVWHS